jgi:uncharacterized protein YbjT (DUF2867 family)
MAVVTRVLVLGGYGLIGSACMRELHRAGMQVTGLGRSRKRALRSDPAAKWIIQDIPSLSADEWRHLLVDFDVVVNASGALQDGARDNLHAIHVQAVERLVKASQTEAVRIIQISAAGVSATASTEFFRSKAQGDAILAERAADWVIFRPTLVLSPEAYGGTALLRAASALPGLLPVILPDAQVQTVHIDDVARAVVLAAKGEVPNKTTADLSEPNAQSFPVLVQKTREWLGLGRGVAVPVPAGLLRLSGYAADGLGRLGWRSPLRTTAIQALKDGIRGDASGWSHACRPLEQSFADMPATRQERSFSRLYFLMPLAIGTLAIFWVISGIIALSEPNMAIEILTQRGASNLLATSSVWSGIIADITLGLAIVWRSKTRLAALGMILVSIAYLVGAALMASDLWLDPLGPIIKVFPSIALAFFVWVLVEDE